LAVRAIKTCMNDRSGRRWTARLLVWSPGLSCRSVPWVWRCRSPSRCSRWWSRASVVGRGHSGPAVCPDLVSPAWPRRW